MRESQKSQVRQSKQMYLPITCISEVSSIFFSPHESHTFRVNTSSGFTFSSI